MAERRRRWPWVVTCFVAAGVAGLAAAAVRVADLVTDPGTTYPFGPNNEALAVDGDLVTIGAGVFSSVPGGRWGLQSDAGNVDMVELVELDVEADTVTWRVDGPADARPAVGDEVRVDDVVFEGDPLTAAGLAFDERSVAGPLGPLPVWVVPTAADRRRGTIVYVHALGYDRQQANRFLRALTAAGWDVVVPTYRGDEGAPGWPDRRMRLGTRAWADLAAVVGTIDADGPVVLFGASLGGSVVVQLLDRAPGAADVDAVILDGPPLSLDDTMRFQAARARVPGFLEPVVLPLGQLAADLRFGVDTASLEQVQDDATFDVPTLLLHGTADGVVPPGPAERLAAIDDDVQLVMLEGADHVRGWNADPDTYEGVLLDFLADVR